MLNKNHYPTSYSAFETHVEESQGYCFHLGLKGGPSSVFRFCNRYRIAKAFQGLKLEGYGPTTVQGYSGLMSVFLAWSAFELFCSITAKDQSTHPSQMNVTKLKTLQNTILLKDKNGAFRDFLKARVNLPLKRRIEDFESGDVRMTPFIAAAIRHIFSHGHLSASPKNTDPEDIAVICKDVRDFLLSYMDEEFSKIVNQN